MFAKGFGSALLKAGAGFVVLSCMYTSLWADDVTDTVEEAMAAYKKGEYKKAGEDLAYALEIINQKKGNNLKSLFPEPLAGWNADEAQAQSGGIYGGGTLLSRYYRKAPSSDDVESPEQSVSIEFIMDSPMMQGVIMMMSNPAIATADGGELTRVKREKAVVKYDRESRTGDVKMVIDSRILITVTGNDVSKEEMMAYVDAIRFEELKTLK